MNLVRSGNQTLGNLGEPSQQREPSSWGPFRAWLGAAVQGFSSLPAHQNHPVCSSWGVHPLGFLECQSRLWEAPSA